MILLVGKSGTGKDSLVKAFNLKAVVSHTERPERPGEVNGIDKWFESMGYYHSNYYYVNKEQIIAHTVIDGYNYWVTKYDLTGKDIFVVDPNGVLGLMDHYGDKFTENFSIIVLQMNGFKRFFRLIMRDIKSDVPGHLKVKAIRKSVERFFSDFKTFKELKWFKTFKCTTIIDR